MLAAQAITDSARPGRRRYEPIAQIGRGGMAEVLLTMVDAGGGAFRLEVLKRIWPELATDPDFVQMFLDEARLSLRLNHPNVVQTHEVLVDDGELAIAMEYLEGQPLTRILNRLLRGPSELSLPLRLRILTRVLAGLEHAHTLTDLQGKPLGVVHRDVSPQNVFVTYDGQVKLVDFGVAKTLAASHHTRPGAIKGKLAYMSPEQLQSSTIDRRADVFAVGVMLWEMLAQRRMWHRMTEVDIVAHLAAGRPLPPLVVPPDANLPAGLDAICARALDPDPDRRYQTAVELEIELERVLAGAADSHARDLGKVVSLAFAKERAERRAVIERCVRRRAQRGGTETRAYAHARVHRQAQVHDASELPAIDVAIDDLEPEESATPDLLLPPRLLAGRSPAIWWRRAAAAFAAIALVSTVMLALDRRRAPNRQARADEGTVATVAPRARDGAAGLPANGKLGFELLPLAAPAGSSRPAANAAADEREHRRRHRRHRDADENATLPPTAEAEAMDIRP